MSEFPTIYRLKVVLLGISPMIWRRLLVSGECTITDLHYILQIAMGWVLPAVYKPAKIIGLKPATLGSRRKSASQVP
jgi:hypothetical protein